MEYFIDTEFLEGTQKESFPINLIRKETKPTIDLISIGIVSEDNREYYAISKDFNLKEAWNRFDEKVEIMSGDMRNRFPKGRKYKVYWIRENVLKPIWRELYIKENHFGNLNNLLGWLNREDTKNENYYFTYNSLKRLIAKYGKANKEIAKEVKDFCTIGTAYSTMDKTIADILYFRSLNSEIEQTIKDRKLVHVFSEKPEFYAYFADYDWVVFCQLFGKMIDLPNEFPMFCIDLKQELDNKADRLRLPNTELSKEQMIETIKGTVNYPKQTNEHHSLEDAKWVKELYKFLQKI
jgi:hypothetical protein